LSLDFSQINVWAVIVSAVVVFMIGAVWWTVLFGKAWVKANAFTDEEVKASAANMGRNFAIFFVAYLVMAAAVALLVINLGIDSWRSGAGLGFLLWLAVAATFGAEKKAAYNKSLAVYLMDTGHELVCLLAMGTILGGWR